MYSVNILFWYLPHAGHCVRHWSPNMTRTLLPLSVLRLDDYETVYIELLKFFCIVQAEKRRAERPPGSRDAKVRESFLEEVMPELSMKGWVSALPGRVADTRWCVKEEQRLFLEVRWSCNGETKAILWNREWAVRNDPERWEVITSYAAISRSWRSFRRWAQGQESTI